MNPGIQTILEKVKRGIPPAPIILIRLLELFTEEDKDTEKITRTIEKDPGLTANLLLLSNSAFFGGTLTANSVEESVLRLGINRIQRIVTLLCAARIIRTPSSIAFRDNQLWEHSLATGIAARQLAAHAGQDENHSYTIGLLHDLGKIVFSECVTNYPQLFLRAMNQPEPLVEVESQVLGLNHCELATLMLQQWKAPSSFYEGIASHHSPSDIYSTIVYLGDQIAYRIDKGFGYPLTDKEVFSQALQRLDLSSEQLPELAEKVETEFIAEKASLQPAFAARKS